MLNLRNLRDVSVWPEELEAFGSGGHFYEKETFGDWLQRTRHLTGGLPNEVLEQWPYRHGSASRMRFFDLTTVSCQEQVWTPQHFLKSVGTSRGRDRMNPEYDYKSFSGKLDGGPPTATAVAMDTGRWDYAPIVLATPGGFLCTVEEHIEKEFLLIEGHKRHRYLNALECAGKGLGPQRVFVLTFP